MKGRTIGQILAPLWFLLSAPQQGTLAAELSHLSSESHDGVTTRRHVYVVGSDPSGRAAIGKALTRLGYVPLGRPDAALGPGASTMEGNGAADRGGYSFTEIPTPRDNLEGLSPVLSPDANYIVARQGWNQSTSEHELSVLGGVVEDEDSTVSWRRMVDSSNAKGEFLELSIDMAEAHGIQAEKWVALCDFLGLGYSTVERLKLWQFP